MKTFRILTAFSIVCLVTAEAGTRLEQAWTIAPGANFIPDEPTFALSATSNAERGIAYNPATGNVLITSRTTGNRVIVVDGATGAFKHQLSTSGVSGGGGAVLSMIGVGEDGVVYAANLVTAAGPNLKIYRWASDAAPTVEEPRLPEVAWLGDPAVDPATGTSAGAQRWGDTMAVRGAGVNTQIAVGSGGSPVAIFTTPDGVTFTPTYINGVTLNGQCRGIAFGAGNTLYVRGSGNQIQVRRVAFNLSVNPGAFQELNQFPIFPLVNASGNQFLAFTTDVVNGWFAGFDYTQLTSTPDTVRIFDISGPAVPPVPLATANIPTNNANGNGAGSTAMGGGRLYVCDTNNGVVAYNIVVTPDAVLPELGASPASRAVFDRGLTTFTATVTGGTPPLSYKWYKDDVALTGVGSEQPSLTVNPVTAASVGAYKCVVSNAAGSVETTPANLTVTPSVDSGALTKVWSLLPGSRAYLGVDDTNRGMDYAAASNRLYLAVRTPSVGIRVLSGVDGAEIGSLDMTGVTGGLFAINMVAVADDGKIYACNLTDGTTPFRVYQWADDQPGTVPVVVFEGSAVPGRMGDSLDVRGSGNGTQILAGARSAPSFAVFEFSEALQAFEPKAFTLAELAPTAPAFGLCAVFGAGNTVWGKSGGQPLVCASFDVATLTAAQVGTYDGTVVASNIGVVAVDPAAGLLGAFQNDNSDNVRLYGTDVPFVVAPPAGFTLLDMEFAPTDNGNGNGTGSVVIAGNRMFALNTNNGLMALTISKPVVEVPPTIGAVTYDAAAGTVTFALTGTVGRTYAIESAAELVVAPWTADGTVTLTTATQMVTRPASGPRRFYRARAVP
jgi:hypothetical protein